MQGLTLEALMSETLKIRMARLVKKIGEVDGILNGNQPIEKLFTKGGITYSPKLLGLDGYADEFSLHPIV